MSNIEPREFNRSSFATNSILFNAILFGLGGVLWLIQAESITAWLWFAISVLSLLNYFGSKKTPYFRITKEAIIFPAPIGRWQRIVKWEAIKEINQTSKRKIELILTNGKKIKIYLSYVDKKERENLIQILKTGIED